MADPRKRWFGVVTGGYSAMLGFYPDEAVRARRTLGDSVGGVYTTQRAAHAPSGSVC